MIANITQGSHLQPIIDYNEKKVKEGDAVRLQIANVFNDKLNTGVFLMSNLGYNSKRKDKFIHISLNFPQEDIPKIDDTLLKNIVRDYLLSLGFNGDHPYIVYKHTDTLHPHIHIVTSKIQENGKPIEDSNLKRRSQQITRDLEFKYDLEKVSSNKQSIVLLQSKPIGNFSLRDQLNYTLKDALTNYRVNSFKELQEYLNKNNLNVEKIQGIRATIDTKKEYSGIVFNAYIDNFKQNQKGIKASSLYLKPTEKNLEKIFQRNIKFHKARRSEIKNQLDYSLDKYKSISISDLERLLNKKGVSFNHKLDSKGNLVGVSFTDLKSGYKYTGENIGKNYTAKNLKMLLQPRTELFPSAITELNFNRYKKSIDQLTEVQQVHTLLALGFNVQKNGTKLLISDYSNPSSEGYILFKNNSSIDNITIENYKNVKELHFNKLSLTNQLEFEYNRAKFRGDEQAMNYALNEIHNNEQELNKESNSQFNAQAYMDEIYQDVYQYQNHHEHQENGLADIDKKKKRIPFKRKK
jgi:hypothetical protein